MLTGKVTRGSRWVDRAAHYAAEFGWKIVPISTSSRSSSERGTDPIARQLGASPLVEVPDEATSDPEVIEDLGTQLPSARIGVLTGEDSNLLAVELNRESDPTPLRQHVESLAGEARRVVGPSREYLLFHYPDLEEPLPPLTKMEDVVLHGESSVVFLPWRHFEWGLDSGEGTETAGRELLSLFDLAEHLTATKVGSERTDDSDQPDPQLTLPLDAETSGGSSRSEESEPTFRSGDALRAVPEEQTPTWQLPWVSPGGLTVLTGRPKTSGKSTWALHLAAHVAAGEPFLGFDVPESDVVVLAEATPAAFRRFLDDIDVVDDSVRSRFHVLHTRDVRRLDWPATLQLVYRKATTVNATLLVVDSLHQFVQLKGGRTPTGNEDVVQLLTAGGPSDCAILAVQSSSCTPRESISHTGARLDLLGAAADAVMRIDNLGTEDVPSLRRLHTVSRFGPTTRPDLCALRDGSYHRIGEEDLEEAVPNFGADPPSAEDRLEGPRSNPLLSD